MDKKQKDKTDKKNKSNEKQEKTPNLVVKHIGEVFVEGSWNDVYLSDYVSSPGAYGHYLPGRHKIFLNKHQSPHHQLTTLIHEMIHCMLIDRQAENFLTNSSTIINVVENITECLDSPVLNDLILNRSNQQFFIRVLNGEFSSGE